MTSPYRGRVDVTPAKSPSDPYKPLSYLFDFLLLTVSGLAIKFRNPPHTLNTPANLQLLSLPALAPRQQQQQKKKHIIFFE